MDSDTLLAAGALVLITLVTLPILAAIFDRGSSEDDEAE